MAEVADDLTVGVLVAELFQLLTAKAEQHLFGALVAAIAMITHIAFVEDVGVKALQGQFHHVLGRLARTQQLGDGRHRRDVLFQLGDLGVGRAGKQLQQIAARTGNGQVLVHQNAQRADSRDLLAVGIVAGQVLGDLAGHQRDLTDGRLFLQAVVADDGQHAVLADGPAHIQMAVLLERKFDQRVIDAALDVARAIGARNDDARRAAARNTQGHGVPVVLEHGTHQGRTRQQTAKGRAAGGAGLVELLGFADDLGGIDAAEHDAAVFRQAANQI